MTILDAASTKAKLIMACTAAGAPGTFVTGPSGLFNPVHELMDGVAATATAAINAVGAAAFWSPPPVVPYPGTVPIPAVIQPANPVVVPGATPVKTLPAITLGQMRGQAQSLATSLGWVGTHRSVLFDGVFDGLFNALATSVAFLSSAAPFTTYAPGTVFTYTPVTPLVATPIGQAINAQFLSNTHLGLAGDPSRRVLLAQTFAAICVAVWSSVTPSLVVVGGGATPPVPVPVTFT